MVEFYIHNLTLTDISIWDPNVRFGDTRLIALASWINFEEERVEEVNRVMSKEEKEPLYFTVELVSPMVVIGDLL